MSNDHDAMPDDASARSSLPFAHQPRLSTAGDQPTMGDGSPPPMSPGDEAPEGTPGTGENVCEHCEGTGHDRDGKTCPVCEGTGKVITGIGGA